jgi:hypothetical protein
MTTKPTKADVEAAFVAARKQDSYCAMGKIIAESEFGDVITAKVEDEVGYSAATISRVLKGLGFPPVSKDVISKHRRGICRCI